MITFVSVVICFQQACFFTGSSTDGFYKTCYYDCPMGGTTITVPATSVCPTAL